MKAPTSMDSPAAQSVTLSETHDENTRAASAPIVDEDTEPLLTSEERKKRHMPKRASDGRGGSKEEEDEARLRWPVRHCSASVDPLTRDRRIKRIETFIDRAKQRGTSYREPLRTPSDGGSIRRVRTAPTPVRRRSSSAMSSLLWLTRSRSKESGAESLLRRVGHHIRARPRPNGDLHDMAPSEESFGSSCSAPEVPITASSSSSPLNPGASPVLDYKQSRHQYHSVPALHLCNYRRSSSLRTNSSPSDYGSASPSSIASIKSACADTTTTLADVHVVKFPQDEDTGTLTPGRLTPSPSMHIVESGRGPYHLVWGEPSSSKPSISDADPTSISPDEVFPRSPSPSGLERVNTKLEKWSFAARESTALDKSRSHPHFRSYVEVYQDDEDPQFDMDDDENVLFMAPPNSERPTPAVSAWQSRRSSQAEGNHSNNSSPLSGCHSSSSSSSPFEPPKEQQQQAEGDSHIRFAMQHRPQHNDEYNVLFPCYSPRPNKTIQVDDRRRKGSRSLSSLSNTSDMSDNATSLLKRHEDSVVLMAERCPDPVELPVGNPWTHRDSVALAKERIRKKHANETGEALVGGIGILKGVGKGGFERRAPLDVPRVQQITYMGVMSPIPDLSPPNSGTNTYNGSRAGW